MKSTHWRQDFPWNTFHDEYNQLKSPNKYGFRQGTDMEKQKAIDLLKKQQSLLEGLKQKGCITPKLDKWRMNTKDLIAEIALTFPRESIKHFPRRFQKISFGGTEIPDWTTDEVPDFIRGLVEAFNLLQSLIENLEHYVSDDETTASAETKSGTSPSGSDVFIVHGHDEAVKHKVARCIEQMGLTAIVLDEQADKGLTVIEKFEENSKNVGFAVVLFTLDDKGRSVKEDDLKPRARQNVVFELGYFVGKLGRNRVCLLRKGDVEIPSDYTGVLYTPGESNLKLKLAKEIKAAGLPVDTDKMI